MQILQGTSDLSASAGSTDARSAALARLTHMPGSGPWHAVEVRSVQGRHWIAMRVVERNPHQRREYIENGRGVATQFKSEAEAEAAITAILAAKSGDSKEPA